MKPDWRGIADYIIEDLPIKILIWAVPVVAVYFAYLVLRIIFGFLILGWHQIFG